MKGVSLILYGFGVIGGVVIIESKVLEDYLYYCDYYVDVVLIYLGISNCY